MVNKGMYGVRSAGALTKYGVHQPFYARTNPGIKFYKPPAQGYAPGGVSWLSLQNTGGKSSHYKMYKPGDAYTGSGVAFQPYQTGGTQKKVPGGSSGVPGGYAGPTEGSTPNPPKDSGPDPRQTWLDQLDADIDRQIAEARQAAIKGERDLLVGFGSQSLARQYLGNDPIIGTISDANTSQSILGRQKFAYGQARGSLEENLGQGNLFYGGARVAQQTDLGRQNISNIYDKTQTVQTQLNELIRLRNEMINGLIRQRIQAHQPPQTTGA